MMEKNEIMCSWRASGVSCANPPQTYTWQVRKRSTRKQAFVESKEEEHAKLGRRGSGNSWKTSFTTHTFVFSLVVIAYHIRDQVLYWHVQFSHGNLYLLLQKITEYTLVSELPTQFCCLPSSCPYSSSVCSFLRIHQVAISHTETCLPLLRFSIIHKSLMNSPPLSLMHAHNQSTIRESVIILAHTNTDILLISHHPS